MYTGSSQFDGSTANQIFFENYVKGNFRKFYIIVVLNMNIATVQGVSSLFEAPLLWAAVCV